MRREHISTAALPAWCKLNNVSFHDVVVQDLGVSGHGIVTNRALSSEEATFDIPALMMVPNDLILCHDTIDEHVKVDGHFRQLIEAAGGKSLRGNVLLFLIMQITINSTDRKHNLGVSSPWTEYVKMLPDELPLPTMWTEAECMMLKGTSLEAALTAKLVALEEEFEALKVATTHISWCQKHWWDNEVLQIGDWILVDAWFRSRCLEHPDFGEAMIPSLDMVNHSSDANAFYQPGSDGCVQLLLRPEKRLEAGTEITISYGDGKSKAEMLFSYGFIEEETTTGPRALTLPLQPSYTVDPLCKAKEAAFSLANIRKTVEIISEEGSLKWTSAFLYMIIANEEDGLDFRVLQATDGSRGSLRVFWQERDVTESLESFDTIITEDRDNSLREVLMLRAVVMLEEQLQGQLHRLDVADEEIAVIAEETDLNDQKQEVAISLREEERRILEEAIKSLVSQKLELFQNDKVQHFLGARNATDSNHEDSDAIEDFS